MSVSWLSTLKAPRAKRSFLVRAYRARADSVFVMRRPPSTSAARSTKTSTPPRVYRTGILGCGGRDRREAGTVFSIFIPASLCVLRHLTSNIRDDGERAFRRPHAGAGRAPCWPSQPCPFLGGRDSLK